MACCGNVLRRVRESLSSKREEQNGEHAEEPWGGLLTFGDLQKYWEETVS